MFKNYLYSRQALVSQRHMNTGNIVIFVQVVVFVYVDGVRLSFGNATTIRHIVHPSDDI
jgi:hypothetical protein